MTQSLHPAAADGFGQAAQLYQQVRPSYPNEVIAWLKQLHLSPDATLVDLGAGTGKFLPYLMPLNGKIIAVEPIAAMREQLQQQYPQVEIVNAQAEALPFNDASIDLIVCAQSFHWFANPQALQEMHRVLKPQASLVLVWNQRDIAVDWVSSLAKLIEPLEHGTPRFHDMQWKQLLDEQDLFKFNQLQLFKNIQHGKVSRVVSQRLCSTSFIAALPPIQQQRLVAQFEKIISDYTGKTADDEIDFPYVTHIYHYVKCH